MKRLFAALILLIITLGFTVYAAITVNNYSSRMLSLINQSQEDFLNKKSTDDNLSKLEEIWKEAEPMLYIFTNHEALENISVSICKVKAGDSEDFLKESAELKEKVDHLRKGETFSFRSFF